MVYFDKKSIEKEFNDSLKSVGLMSVSDLILWLLRGLTILGMCWFLLSVTVYNVADSLIVAQIIPESCIVYLTDMQNILNRLINVVVTPCFFGSFMLYLLYKVLLAIFNRRTMKKLSEDQNKAKGTDEDV